MHRPGTVFLCAIAMAWSALSGPVIAAPTCQDRNGDAIRCGTPGAMPVGWRLPPEEQTLKDSLKSPTSTAQILEVLCALGVFFALMALLPQFEDKRAADWDKQEDDE